MAKMMGRIKLGMLRGLVALVCALLLAPAPPPIDLKTDEKKIRLLWSLSEIMPDIFRDAATYEIDLFHVLEQQVKLQSKLNAIPSYLELRAKRTPLTQLTIQRTSKENVTSRKINPEVVDAWRHELLEELGHFKESGFGDALNSELKKTLASIERIDTQGFAMGLIQLLEPQEREAAMRLPFESKLALIEKRFSADSSDLVPRGFKASIFGVQGSLTGEQAIELLKKALAEERRAQQLIQLHILLQDESGALPQNLASARQKISNLSESSLDLFNEKVAYKQRMERLAVPFLNKKNQVPKTLKAAEKGVERRVNSVSSATILVEEKASGKPLILVEQSPEVALFRGNIGGDCATQYSFGYPNSPLEKVFFVYEEGDPKAKGYISLTQGRTASNESALFIHTINGPRLSAADTEAILLGLYKNRESLGGQAVFLPAPKDRKDDLGYINYTEIRSAIENLTQNSSNEAFYYKDRDTRLAIDKFSDVEYDLYVDWKEASRLKPSDEKLAGVQVKEIPAPAFELKGKFTRAEGALLLLNFFGKRWQISDGHRKTFEKISAGLGINASEFNDVILAAHNINGTPIEEHRNRVKKAFAALGIDATDEFFEKRPDLFDDGDLASSDAYTSEKYARANIRKLIVSIEKNGPDGGTQERVLNALRANETILAKDPEMKAFAKKMAVKGNLSVTQTLGHAFKGENRRVWEDAIPTLIQELKDANQGAGNLIDTLSQIWFADPKFERELVPILRTGSHHQKNAVLSILMEQPVHSPELQAALIDALKDPSALYTSYQRDPSIARRALHKIARQVSFDQENTKKLLNLLEDPKAGAPGTMSENAKIFLAIAIARSDPKNQSARTLLFEHIRQKLEHNLRPDSDGSDSHQLAFKVLMKQLDDVEVQRFMMELWRNLPYQSAHYSHLILEYYKTYRPALMTQMLEETARMRVNGYDRHVEEAKSALAQAQAQSAAGCLKPELKKEMH